MLLTEEGHEKAEQLLAQRRPARRGREPLRRRTTSADAPPDAALRAHALFHRDQHYVVQDGEVIIVDEFTGRTDDRAGAGPTACTRRSRRRKACTIQSENQTLASITFQNYFRMYGKLAGMTGTADTEAYEFQQIYGLETVVIPTHQPMIRKDEHDLVYRTAQEKYDAIIEDIRDCHERGQPVLVGTTSIENSELLSGLLKKDKLPHQVLNAKQHAREAEIVAQAGRPERDHDRHQHGRPRHRHRARRQRREADRSCIEADADAEREAARASSSCATSGRALHDAGRQGRAACTSSAPSATSRGASTTSCAAARAARATRARRASTCRSRTPLLRIFARRPRQRDHGAAEDARGRGDREQASSRARSRARSARSRRATSTSASSCSSTTTSRTTSAR